MMCRKVKKLAWGSDEDLLRQKLDYRFLELLVLFESNSDISDRIRRAGLTTPKYRDYFLNRLRPLLENPNKYLALYLRRAFHPELRDEKMSPEFEAFSRAVQAQEEMSVRRSRSRSQSAAMPSGDEWTVVTPVPHIRCPCYTRRPCPPVVTKEEKMAVEMQKTDLLYKLQTESVRRERKLRSTLEHYLPGYQRVAPGEPVPPRPSSVPTTRGTGIRREVPRGTDAFERLSTPSKRLPSRFPCHASACSAYRQGAAMKEGLGEVRETTSQKPKLLRRRRAKQIREMSSDSLPLC